MALSDFNIRTIINVDDISLAIDYLQNKDLFEPDLQEIKEKIISKETSKENKLIK